MRSCQIGATHKRKTVSNCDGSYGHCPGDFAGKRRRGVPIVSIVRFDVRLLWIGFIVPPIGNSDDIVVSTIWTSNICSGYTAILKTIVSQNGRVSCGAACSIAVLLDDNLLRGHIIDAIANPG